VKTDTKQNISSIRHFLKKRHWVSDVFAGMCLNGSPSSEGSSYDTVFSFHGNFQNYVRDMGSYERMRERARHTRRNLWQSRSG